MRDAFGAATEERRLRAVRAACERAVTSSDLGDPLADAALDALRPGAAADVSLVQRLRELRDGHDAACSDLEQREGPSDASHLRFRQARAADSLANALEGDAAEALYEAIYAADDTEAAVAEVLEELRG